MIKVCHLPPNKVDKRFPQHMAFRAVPGDVLITNLQPPKEEVNA